MGDCESIVMATKIERKANKNLKFRSATWWPGEM